MKKKCTFAIPKKLQEDLRTRVIKDGYGLRGKSLWINEAIKDLLMMKDFYILVHYNEQMGNFEKMEAFVMDYSLYSDLEEASIIIRKKFPLIEGLKSKIIRVAILQRLIRK